MTLSFEVSTTCTNEWYIVLCCYEISEGLCYILQYTLSCHNTYIVQYAAVQYSSDLVL